MKLGELRNWLWSEGTPMKRNWLAAVLYAVGACVLLASQMVGYIISGDPTYITSYNNARSLIRRLERDELLEEFVRFYIVEHDKG